MNLSKTFLISIVVSILASLASSFFVLEHYDTQGQSSDVINTVSVVPEVQSLKQIESGVQSIAKKLRSSVVNIIISQDIQLYKTDPFGFFYEPSGTVRKKVGGGTGFFITKDGLILTNKHVVSQPDATYTVITGDNEEFSARVVAIDPMTDLAVVQALTKDEKKLTDRKIVEFVKDTRSVDVGSFVIAMGNALAEFQNTLTFGIISGLGRTIEAGNQAGWNVEQLTGLLQTDAAINPGNSGGPLVNLDGKVVGINTAIAAGANGLGFAIPLSEKEVDYMLRSIEKYKTIKRPFIGIRYSSLDANIAKANNLKSEYGDYINLKDWVVAWSPAEKAGLKSGDIILEVEGKKLSSGYSIRDVLVGKMPGDSVKLSVLRAENGEKEEIKITLWEI